MPASYYAEHIINPSCILHGEVPRTRFDVMERRLCVELMQAAIPDPRIMSELTNATHKNRLADIEPLPIGDEPDASKEAMCFRQLQEIPEFIIRTRGISRVFTHQLVRQRVGITFMQNCTGDSDFRHANIIVPGEWTQRPECFAGFIFASLEAKKRYAQALDMGISTEGARYILPHAVETFIYLKAPISVLSDLYHKRCCTMSQTWEMVLWAEALKACILERYPDFAWAFESPCEAGHCWFHKGRRSGFWTPVWQPDKQHDTFEWNPDDMLHNQTNAAANQINKNIRLPITYVGDELCD